MIADEFRADKFGRRYADVLEMPGFDLVLGFFDSEDRQRRMIESERHHDRPPLAGVIRELEANDDVKRLYERLSAKQAIRFRQAVGVIVRIVMTKHGWWTAPRAVRGSLMGLSQWFTRAERYYIFD